MPRPAQIASNEADLTAGLKESIVVAKRQKSGARSQKTGVQQ